VNSALLKRNRIRIIGVFYALFTLVFLVEALITPSLNYVLPFVSYGGTFRYAHVVLGPVKISMYWLMHGVGILGMIYTCLHRAEKFQLGKAAAVITAVLLAVFGFVGAKLLYLIENWDYVMEYGLSLGGVSFFGTVFFMPLVIPLMALVFHKKPSAFLDYCTPAGIVMLTSIRTGCFFRGCCNGVTLWALNRPITLPSQLVECTLDVFLLDMILRLEAKGKYQGKLYAAFMGGYGLLRFLVECMRDTSKNLLHLSHGQWFSVVCVLIGTVVLLGHRSRKAHAGTVAP
jgi:phosphatidylglycerol:prolipoprotein diacylglycerol transferase